MKFKPFDDRILVKLEPKTERTPGGIVLPGRDEREPYRAKVLAVGSRATKEPYSGGMRSASEASVSPPTQLKAEDTILCMPYDATEIDVEGEKLHIVRERDVFGVFA